MDNLRIIRDENPPTVGLHRFRGPSVGLLNPQGPLNRSDRLALRSPFLQVYSDPNLRKWLALGTLRSSPSIRIHQQGRFRTGLLALCPAESAGDLLRAVQSVLRG